MNTKTFREIVNNEAVSNLHRLRHRLRAGQDLLDVVDAPARRLILNFNRRIASQLERCQPSLGSRTAADLSSLATDFAPRCGYWL
jgi:hypothetical protein